MPKIAGIHHITAVTAFGTLFLRNRFPIRAPIKEAFLQTVETLLLNMWDSNKVV